MTDAQLELSLDSTRLARVSRSNGQVRASTARWWFRRMRQVVDRALDWEPAPPPRPEQIWFSGTHRQVRLNA